MLIKNILDFLTENLNTYGYYCIALATFFEGAAIPFPSLIILILTGFMVASGRLDFLHVVIIAAASYTVGATIPYYIGHFLNTAVFKKFRIYNKAFIKHNKQADDLFIKFGERAVCFTRPVLIGNYISFYAGARRMKLYKFYIYTFLGILPWATAVVLISSKFGSNYKAAFSAIKDYLNYFSIIFVVLVSIYLIYKTKLISKLFKKKSAIKS